MFCILGLHGIGPVIGIIRFGMTDVFNFSFLTGECGLIDMLLGCFNIGRHGSDAIQHEGSESGEGNVDALMSNKQGDCEVERQGNLPIKVRDQAVPALSSRGGRGGVSGADRSYPKRGSYVYTHVTKSRRDNVGLVRHCTYRSRNDVRVTTSTWMMDDVFRLLNSLDSRRTSAHLHARPLSAFNKPITERLQAKMVQSLRELSGASPSKAVIKDSVLVIIDAQNE